MRKRVFRRGKEERTIDDILSRVPGLHYSSARRRGLKWEADSSLDNEWLYRPSLDARVWAGLNEEYEKDGVVITPKCVIEVTDCVRLTAIARCENFRDNVCVDLDWVFRPSSRKYNNRRYEHSKYAEMRREEEKKKYEDKKEGLLVSQENLEYRNALRRHRGLPDK